MYSVYRSMPNDGNRGVGLLFYYMVLPTTMCLAEAAAAAIVLRRDGQRPIERALVLRPGENERGRTPDHPAACVARRFRTFRYARSSRLGIRALHHPAALIFARSEH